MSIPVPTIEPAVIIAGDSISWTRALPDYPASGGWVLNYALRGPQAIDLATVASGDDHLAEIASAASAAYVPGSYAMQGYVVKAAERITVYSSPITISADLVQQGPGYDGRTQNRRILDALNAAIEGRASRTDLEYTINSGSSSRTVKSLTVTQLLAARDRYTLMVWREQHPGQLAPQIRITVGGGRG